MRLQMKPLSKTDNLIKIKDYLQKREDRIKVEENEKYVKLHSKFLLNRILSSYSNIEIPKLYESFIKDDLVSEILCLERKMLYAEKEILSLERRHEFDKDFLDLLNLFIQEKYSSFYQDFNLFIHRVSKND